MNVFSKSAYDIVKWIALLILPGLAALYFTLAQVWVLPYAETVVGAAAVIDVFLGILLGISSDQYKAQYATPNDPWVISGFLIFKPEVYDGLKWVAQILLPGAATLYFTLAAILNLPYPEQVVGSITAIDTFLGLILGISSSLYNKQRYP